MTTTTKTELPHLDENDLRSLFNLAHSKAIDYIHEADQDIAWLAAAPGRMSRHAMLRGHRDTWSDREERGQRELANAKDRRAKYIALVEKLEAVFAAEFDAGIADFAAAMRERWAAAKRADRKGGKQ
jgi:hypothetical protein